MTKREMVDTIKRIKNERFERLIETQQAYGIDAKKTLILRIEWEVLADLSEQLEL